MTREGHWGTNVFAGAVTVCGRRFLLLKRSDRDPFLPAVWGIPAGQIQGEEDPEKTCMRELLEETGLHGELGGLIGYSFFLGRRRSIFLRKRRSLRVTNVQLNFVVHVTEYDIKLDPASHSAYKWLSWDDAENALLDSFTRDIIKSALQHLQANGRSVSRSAGLLVGHG